MCLLHDSLRGRGKSGRGAVSADSFAFEFGGAAPDSELLARGECLVEARLADGTFKADSDGGCDLVLVPAFGVEKVRVLLAQATVVPVRCVSVPHCYCSPFGFVIGVDADWRHLLLLLVSMVETGAATFVVAE